MFIRRLLAILALAVLCIGVPVIALGDTPSNVSSITTQDVSSASRLPMEKFDTPEPTPTPDPNASPDPGVDAALDGIVASMQTYLAKPCGKSNNVFTRFVDDIFDLITFQGNGSGLAVIQGRVVSIGMSIYMFAFGFALIRFAKELSGQNLDKMIVESAWKMGGLVLGIIAINVAGGFYLQPSGFAQTPGAPVTVLVRDAGTNFAAGDGTNGQTTGLLQPLVAGIMAKLGADSKTVTVPRTPGTEIAYTSCIATKVVGYSIVSGFALKATGGSGGGSGVVNWVVGGTLDLLVGVVMAIIYLILTLPAVICIFLSGLFMANHIFVLSVNANLLGVVAIFTLGFLGHPAVKQWGTPFFSLLYGIFTTSFVLAFVNIIIVCGGAIIESELKKGTANILGIAFGTAAMGAFIVSMAIRAPKLAAIFSGKMGYDTADAIGGLAATAAAATMVGKGLSLAAGALRNKVLPKRSVGAGKSGGSEGTKGGAPATGGDPSAAASAPKNGARPTPTSSNGDPSKTSNSSKPGAAPAGDPKKANAKDNPQQKRDDAGTPKRVAKAGSTLRDRAAAAKATGNDQKQQAQTAKALENFASNLDHQSESARKKGDERLANNSAALSDAARELAAHAPAIDTATLAEATTALAGAAESAHLVPPTDALQKSASALAAIDNPDAKNAARKLDAAAAAGSDSKYNAGRAMADQARTAAASTAPDARNLQGTSLGRSINNAKNTALGKADQKTLGGKTAAVAARALDSLASAKELNPRAAAAVNAIGNVLAGALEGHATSEGTATALQAASQQLAAAATDPAIDTNTRAAYLQAATATSAGANSIRQAVAAGEIEATSTPQDAEGYNAGHALADVATTNADPASTTATPIAGTPLGRNILAARNAAAGRTDSTTLNGAAAGVVAKTLTAVGGATAITPRAAAAMKSIGSVLSTAIASHATTEGTTVMLQAAANDFTHAAADPTIDDPTRAAYQQAALASNSGASQIATAARTGTYLPPPSSTATGSTRATPAPMGTGYGTASIAAQSLPNATSDQQNQIHATAAAAGWREHAATEQRTGSPARADAANRIAQAFQTIGRIGAPKNDAERQAYALVYSASNALEHGTASTMEITAMLSTSEILMRSASQTDDSPRGLHLNTAAVQLGSTAAVVGRLENAPASTEIPVATYTTVAPNGPATNEQPGPPSAQRPQNRPSSPNPQRRGNAFGDALRSLHRLHGTTTHHEPNRF